MPTRVATSAVALVAALLLLPSFMVTRVTAACVFDDVSQDECARASGVVVGVNQCQLAEPDTNIFVVSPHERCEHGELPGRPRQLSRGKCVFHDGYMVYNLGSGILSPKEAKDECASIPQAHPMREGLCLVPPHTTLYDLGSEACRALPHSLVVDIVTCALPTFQTAVFSVFETRDCKRSIPGGARSGPNTCSMPAGTRMYRVPSPCTRVPSAYNISDHDELPECAMTSSSVFNVDAGADCTQVPGGIGIVGKFTQFASPYFCALPFGYSVSRNVTADHCRGDTLIALGGDYCAYHNVIRNAPQPITRTQCLARDGTWSEDSGCAYPVSCSAVASTTSTSTRKLARLSTFPTWDPLPPHRDSSPSFSRGQVGALVGGIVVFVVVASLCVARWRSGGGASARQTALLGQLQ